MTKDSTFQQLFSINLFGAIQLTNFVLKHMIDDDSQNDAVSKNRRQYTILNVGSVQSYIAIPYRSACKYGEETLQQNKVKIASYFLYSFIFKIQLPNMLLSLIRTL